MAIRDSSTPIEGFHGVENRVTGAGENDRQNRVVVDGTHTTAAGTYVITVSGEIERDPELGSTDDLPWDEEPVRIDGGRVRGIVGKAAEGFRYSGEITGIEVAGAVVVMIDGDDR